MLDGVASRRGKEVAVSFRHRLMFFLSQFETDCKACLRRWNCAECRNRDAVPLLDALRRHDGSRPQRPPEDNSLGARVKSVLAQRRGSAAPLRASPSLSARKCPWRVKPPLPTRYSARLR